MDGTKYPARIQTSPSSLLRSESAAGENTPDAGNFSLCQPSPPPLSVPAKPTFVVNATLEHHRCYSGPGTGLPQLSPTLQTPPPHITRTSSYQSATKQYRQISENDPVAYYLPDQSLESLGERLVSVRPSLVYLQSISYTPTTENLARRMLHLGTSNQAPDTSTATSGPTRRRHQGSNPRQTLLIEDGSSEGTWKQFSKGERAGQGSGSSANGSTHSLNTSSEDPALHKMNLVSYLPKIPATTATTSEEGRLAKWGPGVGFPSAGSTHNNPYNYEVLEAYLENVDNPMFNVADTTRRAGNAAIQTMFDPLYAIPGLDGRIPRGFPLYGFSMREMPTANLHEVLEGYGIEPIAGVGYDVDRQNMSLLCAHIGATWLSGVI